MQALLDNYEITWVSDNYLKFKMKKKDSSFMLDDDTIRKCSSMLDRDIMMLSNITNPIQEDHHSITTDMDIDYIPSNNNNNNSSNSNNNCINSNNISNQFHYSSKTFLGTRQENQDRFFMKLYENYNLTVIGVLDGHGDGDASTPSCHSIIQHLYHQFNNKIFLQDCNQPKFYSNSIANALLKANTELLKDKEMDFGTTATLAYITDQNKVVCGWVGDSTAVLFRLQKDRMTYKSEYLTRDHKPEDTLEKERILSVGGRVVYRLGSYRVIPKQGVYSNEDIKKKRLALNMSRALGHSILSQYGISPLPDFSETSIATGDILIVASDGLWNVLELDEICKILCKYSNYSIKDLSDYLIDLVDKKCIKDNSQCDNTTICCYRHH